MSTTTEPPTGRPRPSSEPRPSVPRRRRVAGALAVATAVIATVVALSAGSAGAATTVPGMDVSGHQGNVDWTSAYNNGARFAYVKASEGTTYLSPNFAQQYNGSAAVGMIRGAYHFALPDRTSGGTQADYFVSHGGGWSGDGKTLPPMLDIEYNPYGATCYGLSQSAMTSWIVAFSNEVHARTRKYPMIYTTFDWWSSCTGNTSALAATNPFNIAKYSTSPPTAIPAGTATYTIWQNADHGIFPGDQDIFHGDYSRLQALATNPD